MHRGLNVTWVPFLVLLLLCPGRSLKGNICCSIELRFARYPESAEKLALVPGLAVTLKLILAIVGYFSYEART